VEERCGPIFSSTAKRSGAGEVDRRAKRGETEGAQCHMLVAFNLIR
jgi:hypothetical protein